MHDSCLRSSKSLLLSLERATADRLQEPETEAELEKKKQQTKYIK